jgi:hypothetical protein
MKTLTINPSEIIKAKITATLIIVICLFSFRSMAQGPGQGQGQGNPNSGGNGHTPLVVCLNVNTLTIDQNALLGMMQAGATLGPCTTTPGEDQDDDITIDPPAPQGCYAVEVMEYKPAKRNDGGDIASTRIIANNALGAPQNSDVALPESQLNFVSLGFGGSITLRMAAPIKNGEGNDFKVYETTYGNMSGNCNRYPERVKAFASQDNCNWIYLGEKCQDAAFDLGPLNWAEYIRLVDASPIGAAFNNSVADGYDVDGIECLNGFEENPVMQDFGSQYAMEVVSFNQGLRKNGTAVLANRSNQMQAIGAPDGTDNINFVSLGFGGNITLKFGYVIFDKDGDDLQIVETSFGNPSCNNYPESALVEVSLDGENWIELGEICLDGTLDFATGGVKFAQYIRIHDRSNATRFGGTADAYDVDGVVVINAGCNNENAAERIVDNVWTTDETFGVNIYPNPFINNVNVELLNTSEGQINISLMSYTGQVVNKWNVNAGRNEVFVQNFELSNLKPGVYFVRVESSNAVETHKLIKQ